MRRLIFALCLLGLGSSMGAVAAERLRAGAATSNITPPLGGGIVGGFVPIPSQHVHDELHAVAWYWTTINWGSTPRRSCWNISWRWPARWRSDEH